MTLQIRLVGPVVGASLPASPKFVTSSTQSPRSWDIHHGLHPGSDSTCTHRVSLLNSLPVVLTDEKVSGGC